MRRYLEKKAAAKEQVSLDDDDAEADQLPEKRLDRHGEITKQQVARFGRSRDLGMDDSNNSKEKVDDKTEARRGFFSKRRQNGKVKKPGSNLEGEEVSQIVERPAFQSVQHGQSSANKKLQPRAVAIPYSRLRKERFYDWPPDPTVSRATPIALYPETTDDLDDSLTASVPDFTMPDHEDYPSTLRRRNSSSGPGPADIPTNIAF